ncbi:MAG: leucyl aminopeptidase [Pigmentiphaga sp.]|nr:leucyl aminopeptidase [Pigmentiphaga sp.]
MEFSTPSLAPENVKAAALAVGVHPDGRMSPAAQALDDASQGALARVLQTEFKGQHGSTLTLRYLPGVNAERVVLVGLGKAEELTPRRYAAVAAAAAQALRACGGKDAATALLEVEVPGLTLEQRARQLAIAARTAEYRYTTTFGKPPAAEAAGIQKLAVLANRATAAKVRQALREGGAIGEGMNTARELGNLPGNICTPTYLAQTAKQIGTKLGIKVEALERKQLEALKMGAFLSVAKGSDEAPRFIVMQYQGAKGRGAKAPAPTVLVGKGVTFDSGGISIKPAATMDEMKYDMCGAASVIGTLQAIATLKLPVNVVGLIPACENLPSGRANKPGDVVTSMSGQTIEVLNTDAEGRLLLCDALTYAERFKPARVIDIATLTGACVVALGHVNTGLFTADDALAEQLLQASRQAVDPAWRMPLDDEYQPQLKSRFADIANIGGMPAGSVTAACFLSRFTKAYPWAHLDIAGTAWKSGGEKGATGRPVPLLVNLFLN